MKAILFLFGLIVLIRSKLLLVIEYSRHGARSPENFHKPEIFPEGIKKITPEGLFQHHMIGKEFRKRYVLDQNFLPANVTPNTQDILVYSSSLVRTYASGAAQLMGFYPDHTGPMIDYEDEQRILPPINISASKLAGFLGEIGGNEEEIRNQTSNEIHNATNDTDENNTTNQTDINNTNPIESNETSNKETNNNNSSGNETNNETIQNETTNDNETTNNETNNNETNNNEITKNETTNNETTNNETANNETTNNETSTNETNNNNEISTNGTNYNNETSENGTSTNETSGNETNNNNETSENKTNNNETSGNDTNNNNETSDNITNNNETSGNKTNNNNETSENITNNNETTGNETSNETSENITNKNETTDNETKGNETDNSTTTNETKRNETSNNETSTNDTENEKTENGTSRNETSNNTENETNKNNETSQTNTTIIPAKNETNSTPIKHKVPAVLHGMGIIPINQMSIKDDLFFQGYESIYCPKMSKIVEYLRNDPASQAVLESWRSNLFPYLVQILERDWNVTLNPANLTMDYIKKIYDLWESTNFHQRGPVINIDNETLLTEMKEAFLYYMYSIYDKVPIVLKLSLSVLLEDIVIKLNQRITNSTTADEINLKFLFYSGRDRQLFALLKLLCNETDIRKLKNGGDIPFASLMLFELHQDDLDLNRFYIKVSFNDEPLNMYCSTNEIGVCEIHDFFNIVKGAISDNIYRDCDIQNFRLVFE